MTPSVVPDTAVESQVPMNPRDFLILFSLVDQERHGYGLVKEVERQSEGEVRLDPANLYRSLKRMIKHGLVEESERKPAADSHDERRRYYAITGFGRQVVTREAARLDKLAAAVRARNLVPESE